MDYSEYDKVRRSAVPLQLDVVEAFAAGRLSRREFIQRATVLGLSTGAIGMVIAACSGRRRRPPRAWARARPPALPPVPRRAARPVAAASAGHRRHRSGSPARSRCRSTRSRCRTSADTGSRPSRSSSCAPLTRRDPVHIAPGSGARSGRPNADGTVWTFELRQNVKWQDGTPFTADDVVATMERLVKAGNSGLKGVLAAGGAVATDANTVDVHARRRQRQLPVPRLGLQRPDADHPEGLCRRDDARQGTGRDRGLEAQDLQRPDRRDASSATPTGGAARRRSTAPSSSSSTPPARWSPPTRASRSTRIVQFDVLSGKSLLDDPNFSLIARRSVAPSPDLDALRHRSVREEGGPPGPGLHVRPAGAHPAAVPGQGPARQRPRHLAGLSVLRLVRPAADPGHRQGQVAPVRRPA